MGFFDALTWLEASDINTKIEQEAAAREYREERERNDRLKNSIKTLYQEIYTKMDLALVDLSQVSNISRHYNNTFNSISSQNSRVKKIKPEKLFYGVLVGGIGLFLFIAVSLGQIQNGNMSFMRWLFAAIFLFIIYIGGSSLWEFLKSIRDQKVAPTLVRQRKERLQKELKNYPMLSAYGLFLKFSLDRDILSVYSILSRKDKIRADSAKRLLYSCFDMPSNTPTDEFSGNVAFLNL